uniref:ORF39 n=1 Tax=Malaco herpesvirus 2 TaxID=3031798 RepID=A0AA48P7L2_9VIRU|nr:TPA_asm: ORF39 [Malaco herpesvirus 2]
MFILSNSLWIAVFDRSVLLLSRTNGKLVYPEMSLTWLYFLYSFKLLSFISLVIYLKISCLIRTLRGVINSCVGLKTISIPLPVSYNVSSFVYSAQFPLSSEIGIILGIAPSFSNLTRLKCGPAISDKTLSSSGFVTDDTPRLISFSTLLIEIWNARLFS